MLGTQLTLFAVMFQVWELTGSPLATGTIGLLRALPRLLLTPLGGSLADAVDRRRLLMITSTLSIGVAAALTLQAWAAWQQLWLIYLLVALQSCLSALGSPARSAVIPALLPADLVVAGNALNMLAFHLAMLIGPALGGVIAATWGVTSCYLIDTVSFGISLLGIASLPRFSAASKQRPGLRQMLAGFAVVARSRTLSSVLAIDAAMCVLAMPVSLLPALNARFGGAPQTLGWLMSAMAIGATTATVVSGRITRTHYPGRVVAGGAVIFGAALVVVGLAPHLMVAIVALATVGAADVLSVMARGGIVQLATTDEYRGRVNAANVLVGTAGPELGNFRGGVIGALTGAGPALAIGGGACVVATMIIIRRWPGLLRYRVGEVGS